MTELRRLIELLQHRHATEHENLVGDMLLLAKRALEDFDGSIVAGEALDKMEIFAAAIMKAVDEQS